MDTKCGMMKRRMPKWLMLLLLCMLPPFLVRAQALYVDTETFDKHVAFSPMPGSEWDTCSMLSLSAPYAFRGQVPLKAGDSSLLLSPVYDVSSYGKVYLVFDHICKISNADVASVEWREDLVGGRWQALPSSCYRGNASAYRQQRFSDASYTDWERSDELAEPDERWWRTECFDLSALVSYSRVQIRFKIKKVHAETGRFAYGWLLDNVRLYAGNALAQPPCVRLTDRQFAGKEYRTGPFDVRFTVDACCPVSVSAQCTLNGKAQAVTFSRKDFAFCLQLPPVVYGSTYTYAIQATDSVGNTFSLARRFVTVMPSVGRDSNAAVIAALVSPAAHVVRIGSSLPLRVCVRNAGIKDLVAMRVGWAYQGKQGFFDWKGRVASDFYTDTFTVASVTVGGADDSLRLWVEDPNDCVSARTPDTLLYALTACADFLHGTYRIGGSGADFPDVQAVLPLIQRCGLSGTTVLLLDSGVHALGTLMRRINTGDADDSLWFVSLGGKVGNVVLKPDSAQDYVLWLNNVRNVGFRNLTFRLDSSDHYVSDVLRLGDSCRHIWVEHCRFELGVPSNPTGISAYGRKACRDIHIRDNVFSGGGVGLFVAGRNPHDYKGLCVENNVFEAQTDFSLYTVYADFSRICGNAFVSARSLQAMNRNYTAAYLYSCFGNSISSNAFRLYGGKAAMQLGDLAPDSGAFLQVYDNEVFFHCAYPQSAGWIMGYNRRVRFVYNSLLLCGKTSGNTCVQTDGLSDTVEWRHNLFVLQGSGTGNTVWAFASPLHTHLASQFFEHNHYAVSAGGYVQTDRMLASLEDWQSFSGQDAQASEGRVRFKDTSENLLLAHAYPSDFTDTVCKEDMRGKARDALLSTKGAYHAIETDLYDAQPLSLSPQGVRLSASDSVAVECVIANVGREPLSRVRVAYRWRGREYCRELSFAPLAPGDTLHSGRLDWLPMQQDEDTLVLWTLLPNGQPDAYPEHDTLRLCCCRCTEALQGAYTVGGPAADFPTLETAVRRLYRCGVQGPVRFLLQSGTYAFPLRLQGGIPGSSPERVVTFTSQARSADSVLLLTDSTEGSLAAVRLSRISHLVFERLCVESHAVAVALEDGCSDIVIRQCHLKVAEASPYAAVYAAEVKADSIVLSDNLIEGGKYGLRMYGQSLTDPVRRFSVTGNEFRKHAEQSVELRAVQFTDISYNKLENMRLQSVEGDRICANRFRAQEKTHCLYLQEASPLNGSLLIANNECVNRTSFPHCTWEIGPYCRDLQCAHNSFSLTGGGAGKCLVLSCEASLSRIRFIHNLFSNHSHYANSENSVVVSADGSRLTSIYTFEQNHYDAIGRYLVAGDVFVPDLKTWQLLSGQDSLSVSGPLPFVSGDSCLQLQRAGEALCLRMGEVTEDIFGQSRSVVTVKGAYPPVSSVTDACLLQMDLPSVRPGELSALPLRVLVGNAGDSLIRQLLLYWSVNGVRQPDVRWQGSLPPGDTLSVFMGALQADTALSLCVWIQEADSAPDADASDDTLRKTFFFCDSAFSGTYVIGRDFATLDAAWGQLSACGVRGDVKLLLPPGTYEGPFVFDRFLSGSGPAAKVTIASANDSAALVVLSLKNKLQSGQSVLHCLHTGHLVFEKLTVSVPEMQTDACGLSLRFDCEDVEVRQCVFLMQEHSLAAIGQAGEGSVCSLRVVGNTVQYGKYGLRFSGTSSNPDRAFTINDNVFTQLKAYGMLLTQVHGADICRNSIQQQPRCATGFYGIYADRVQDGRWESNRITASRGFYGMYLSRTSGGAAPLLIANNEVHLQVPSSNCGIYLYSGCDYISLLHNSILLEGSGMGKGVYTAYSLQDIKFRNNHVVNLCGTASSDQNHAMYVYPSSGLDGWDADGNVYYSSGKTLSYLGGAVRDLAEWQARCGKDANSRVAPPAYADRSLSLKPLHFDSLQCLSLAEVPFDKEGKERGNPTCAGAYQSPPALAVDWQLLSFVSPDTALSCPALAPAVRVCLRNGGGDTLCLSEHPVEVCLKVEGPLAFMRKIRLSGACMPPLHSEVFTLTDALPMQLSGRYRLAVWVADSMDANPLNDTAVLEWAVSRTGLPYASNMETAGQELSFVSVQGRMVCFVDSSAMEIQPLCGKAALCVPSGNARGGITRMLLPLMDLQQLQQPTLSLWYARCGEQRTSADRIRVLVSTDGGESYTEAAVLFRYKAQASGWEWERADVALSAFAASCVRIVLEAISYGGGNQYVDSLCVRGLPCVTARMHPRPESVSDCRLTEKGLFVVLENHTAQTVPQQLYTLSVFRNGLEDSVYCKMLPAPIPPYSCDTVAVDSAFAWALQGHYRFRFQWADSATALFDTLSAAFSTQVDVRLQALERPPCVSPGMRIYPSVVLRNTGTLAVCRFPLEIGINDSLADFVQIPFLAAGDSMRYVFSEGIVIPELTDSEYVLDARIPLDCDANLGDNRRFVNACLRQEEDSTSVSSFGAETMEVRLCPNPNAGEAVLYVRLPQAVRLRWEIVSLQGQLLLRGSQQGQAGENRIPLRLPSCPAGAYLFRLSDGTRFFVGKWVVW
ncbi:MAG: right-handed parallel beta-helix repeat-containing protein [Bacteroidales bacterium]|nr:right-handed parallel beta-helix repeat-containing protein [Bacteroidales bacterium]